MQRRLWIQRLALLSAGLALSPAMQAKSAAVKIEVWKDANCGCCQDWINHLEKNGFAPTVHNGGNQQARARLGIPAALGSCHTGQVGAYAIEGHVPAREIHRLLKEKPAAAGLAVPGMPVGSPGMDGPVYGGRRDAYAVLLVARDGATSPYARYSGN